MPLALELSTPEGTTYTGSLVAGDFDSGKLLIQVGDEVAAPSRAVQLATGNPTAVNGLVRWRWRVSPHELYSLHQLRAAGVTLQSGKHVARRGQRKESQAGVAAVGGVEAVVPAALAHKRAADTATREQRASKRARASDDRAGAVRR